MTTITDADFEMVNDSTFQKLWDEQLGKKIGNEKSATGNFGENERYTLAAMQMAGRIMVTLVDTETKASITFTGHEQRATSQDSHAKSATYLFAETNQSGQTRDIDAIMAAATSADISVKAGGMVEFAGINIGKNRPGLPG